MSGAGGSSNGGSGVPGGKGGMTNGGSAGSGALAGGGAGGASGSGTTSGAGGVAAAGASGAGGSVTGGRGGSSGATGAAGAASCSGLVLCDDFETYAANSAPSGPWRVTNGAESSVTVDTTRAASGTKSVHFHGTVGANGANAALMVAEGAPVFPIRGTSVFVRFKMYVQRWPNANPMHTRLAWIGTTGMSRNQDGSGYVMETYNGIAIERIASGRYRDTSQRMTDAVNTGKWLCWEFEIDTDAGPPPNSTGTVLPRMWREGTAMSLAIAGSVENWATVSFDVLQFSLFAYQADTQPADFWIDDVAVNTQRIGCPTP